uniref:PDZ domain-containing protein n=1 Tax=Calcidiscus leptoporus TaxID=127549 RepID=A0A7S0JA88_9EUKA|mmetsp:Transcript_47638/g.110447  ORF Transcript_47638/g.110447 Transcript_47638/m.110447 type:complete len:257 (+) Transcript_47638:188-958(+)
MDNKGSAQATTADYLDLSDHPRRVELTQASNGRKLRVSTLLQLDIGETYVTQRGNKLVRVDEAQVLLAGKVRIELEERLTLPRQSSRGSDVGDDVGSAADSSVSRTWNDITKTHSKLVLNVVKPSASSLLGMRVFNSDSGDFAEVMRIAHGGAAETAGIRVGDLVLNIDGQRVRSEEQAAQLTAQPGVHIFEVARKIPVQPHGAARFSLAAAARRYNVQQDGREYALPSDAATMVSVASSASSISQLQVGSQVRRE